MPGPCVCTSFMGISLDMSHDPQMYENEVDDIIRFIMPSSAAIDSRQVILAITYDLIQRAYPNAVSFTFGSFPLKM